MASELTTRTATKTSGNRAAVLQSWADLNVDLASLRPVEDFITRPVLEDGTCVDDAEVGRPVPVVSLSRLVDAEPDVALDLSEPVIDVIDLRQSPNDQQWASCAGRPLFQIGLAALVAATAVGVFTYAPQTGQNLSSIDPVLSSAEAEPVSMPARSASEQNKAQIGLFGAQSPGSGADLAIVGTATSAADTVRWTATVRNQGPGIASQPVRVIQTLPTDLDYISSFGDNWECSFNAGAATVTCDLDQDLGVGQRRQLGIVTTNGGAAAGTRLPTTLAVVGRNSDTDLSNNTVDIVAVVAATDDAGTDSASPGSDDDGSTRTSTSGAAGGLTELPKTGAGLTAFLALAGAAMCLAGRRLLRVSAEHAPVAIAARIDN